MHLVGANLIHFMIKSIKTKTFYPHNNSKALWVSVLNLKATK